MKKIRASIIGFVLVFALAGCSSVSSTSSTPSTPTVAENGYKLFDIDFSPWATEDSAKITYTTPPFLIKEVGPLGLP